MSKKKIEINEEWERAAKASNLTLQEWIDQMISSGQDYEEQCAKSEYRPIDWRKVDPIIKDTVRDFSRTKFEEIASDLRNYEAFRDLMKAKKSEGMQ